MFKVSNRNTRKRCEICSKLTTKTPERRKWRNEVKSINQFGQKEKERVWKPELIPQLYSYPSKHVTNYTTIAIFAKRFILNIWQDSEYI